MKIIVMFSWFAIFALSACDNSAPEQGIVSAQQRALSENSNQNSAFWTVLTLDSDGDGVSNWTEYLAGTDPYDATSVPADSNSDSVPDVFVGPKGNKGDKGDNGDTGPQGLKGEKGVAGGKGEKGDTGATGPIGLTGATGPVGLTGATGAAGPKGNIGLTGATGPQGPKGDKGDTGATGETGLAGPIGIMGPLGPAGQDGKDCTKSCPTGSVSYYIGAQLAYCSAFIDLSVTANFATCLEECAKAGLSISSASDLALMCLSDKNVFSAYVSDSIYYAYLAAADHTLKTSQGTASFLPGYTTGKPFGDGVKRSFCEAVKYASMEGIADYYFSRGSVSISAIDLEKDSSQYLSASDSASLRIVGNVTIECRIKFESLPTGEYGEATFVLKGTGIGGNQTANYHLEWLPAEAGGSNQVRVNFRQDAQNNQCSYDWTPNLNQWYHLAVTRNTLTGEIIIYIDGVAVHSENKTPGDLFENTQSLGIAGNPDGNQLFDGKIDDVRVWNIVRTSSEIAANYQTELVGNESGLVGYWKFDNSFNDATANQNTLTNHNVATFSTDVANVSSAPATSLISGCACGKRP